MAEIDPLSLNSTAQIKELVGDINEFFGMDGNFWNATQQFSLDMETPEQVQDLCRDILVHLFGLEVQGL